MDSLKLQVMLWLRVSFLLGCGIYTQSIVMVLPSEIAPACNGEQLKVTCTTTGSFLRWNITLVEGGPSSEQTPVITNSTMISFLRTSAEGASPLISTVVINPVSRTLNGSRVECIELPLGTSESSLTVVHVMEFDHNYPEVNISHKSVSDQLESDHVTVTLNWTSETSGQLVAYNVSVVPQGQGAIKFNGSAMAQLTLSYNTLYNVSILAAVPCGLNTTMFIILNYINCGHPQFQSDNNDAIAIGNSMMDPATEGTIVNFTCPHGLDLIGPNTSTCMDNGVWVPDPMEVECRGQPTTTCPPDGDVTMNNTCPKSFGTDSLMSTILWSSIGGVTALCCVILFIIIVILLMVKRKGLLNKKFNTSCARSRDINNGTDWDHSSEEMNNHSQVVEAKTLVYADIGPSSLKLQFIHAIQDVDDYRVEYAHLDKDKLEESQRVISLEHKTNGNPRPPIDVDFNDVEPARSTPWPAAVLPPPIPPKKREMIEEAMILNPSESSLSFNSDTQPPSLPPKPSHHMSATGSVLVNDHVQMPPARPPKTHQSS